MMDAAGVATQVLSVTPQLPMVPDAAKAAAAARMVNDIYAELVAKHPGRFRAYGALPLPFVEESLEQIAYVLDALGFAGVALNTFVGADGPLTDPAKIMAGSDYPYFQDEKYTRAINYIRDCGAGQEAISGILRGNAQCLYGLFG